MIRKTMLLTALFVSTAVTGIRADTIEHVHVQVTSVQEAVPTLVQKRIAASIQTVGNHVLLQHDSTEIKERSESYKQAMYDIVNRVLIGYTVDDIQLVPGSDTKIYVAIRPWGNTIRRVRIDVDYGSLPPLGQAMANKDIKGYEGLIENLLIGLPEEALDWANGTVKAVMEQELETMLPEFYPQIVIEPGEEAIVHIYFLPKLPVVRNVKAVIHAENVPRLIFLSTRKHIEQEYAGLTCLPVSFVQRHEAEITRAIEQRIAEQWVVKEYKLHVNPVLTIGEDTTIDLYSKTDFYDIQAGVYMDIGRNTEKRGHHDDTVIRALVGRKINTQHEIYSAFEFSPGSVRWNVMPGYFYRFNRTRIGIHHETRDSSNHWWIQQQLGTKWLLRLDKDMTNHEQEIGLTYRLHDYIGLEYIVSDHDQWLRIIGYL